MSHCALTLFLPDSWTGVIDVKLQLQGFRNIIRHFTKTYVKYQNSISTCTTTTAIFRALVPIPEDHPERQLSPAGCAIDVYFYLPTTDFTIIPSTMTSAACKGLTTAFALIIVRACLRCTVLDSSHPGDSPECALCWHKGMCNRRF